MKNILLSIIGVAFAVGAMASDDVATQLYKTASDQYSKREDLNNVLEAEKNLTQAFTEAVDGDLKYDILILKSRAVYWLAMHTVASDPSAQKEARLKKFEEAYKTAEQASKLNDDYADGHYFYAVALARWGETKGATDAYFRLGELKDKIKATLTRDTRDGRSGEEIDGYGPDRIMGRVYYKLPGMLGGDLNESLKLLTKAYQKAFSYAINGHYLADTYLAFKPPQVDYACKILSDLSSRTPQSLDPDRIPETKEEMVEIVQLKSEKCK